VLISIACHVYHNVTLLYVSKVNIVYDCCVDVHKCVASVADIMRVVNFVVVILLQRTVLL
jgi:hypothetical protein